MLVLKPCRQKYPPNMTLLVQGGHIIKLDTTVETDNPVKHAFFKNSNNISSVKIDGAPKVATVRTGNNALTVILEDGTQRAVFAKQIPILDPIRYLCGEYEGDANRCAQWITSASNPAFLEPFVASVLARLDTTLFPEYYGTFSGVADKFTIDIEDDYAELTTIRGFAERKAAFELIPDPGPCLDISLSETTLRECEKEWEIHSRKSDAGSSDDDDYTTCTASSDDEEPMDAVVRDFPCQILLQEKLHITLMPHLCAAYSSELVRSVVFQVAHGLAVAQRDAGFFHNDLHTLNVMLSPTAAAYRTFKLDGMEWNVPTFGYLVKVIDFGRSIITVRAEGLEEPRTFASLQLYPQEEAGSQYNWGPFKNDNWPELPPNPSFDLAYFAYNLLDLVPPGDPLEDMLLKMLTDADGKNVAFRKDGHERFNGFDLYRAIARYCTNAVPRDVLATWGQPYAKGAAPP
jgi:hypothetical protein